MQLSDEQVALEKTVRDLAQERFGRLFEEAEQKGIFPVEIFGELGKLGLLCMTTDEKRGGVGASMLTECLVVRQLARVSSSLASSVMVHGGVATSAIARHGSPGLRRRFLEPAIEGRSIAGFALTEPDAGSDAAAIKTRAVDHDGSFVLDGRKTYITNGGIADFLTVAAVTDPTARRGHGISLFVVERATAGVETRALRKIGHHAADTVEIFFDGCEIPAENLIGSLGQGFAYLNELLTAGRIVHAARSVGVAEAAIETTLTYTKERTAFGNPLFANQAVAFALCDMATETEAAWQLTVSAADLLDCGLDATKSASMAKLFAAEVAERVASRGMHLHGGFGYMDDAFISRLWREAKLFPVTEGASEIQKRILARLLDSGS